MISSATAHVHLLAAPLTAPSVAGQIGDDDVELARQGDETAFVRLYRAVQPGLLRYAQVLAGADAEDVCAEAWAQACRDLTRFRGGPDDFRGWIVRITRNRAIDLQRTRSRRPATPVPTEELHHIPSGMSGEDAAMTALATSDALAMISSLPPDQAEAVILRAVLGLDAKRAGQVVGKRPGAVRTAAHRGLQKLAERYERYERYERP